MPEQETIAELDDWLQANWDPELTVSEWWERLGLAGWSSPILPTDAYGRGLNRNDAVRAEAAIARFGALPAPGGLGLMLAAPTIAQYGTAEQIERFVRPIVTGQQAWCQLFSEPGAGSDLAGLQTRAERDGDEWVITGQKVWTSGGHQADMGMLLARTDADVPKHQGITWFAFDMLQPGVEVRPLREITGRALFNEVFMTEARVHDSDRIGDLNQGWAVANATLGFERASLGSGGGHSAVSAAVPGTVVGHLDRRAGDFVGVEAADRGGMATLEFIADAARILSRLAATKGLDDDPLVRQELMRLHTDIALGAYSGLRAKGARTAGRPDVPGLANIAKLSMSHIARSSRDLALRLLGPAGTLHGYTDEDAAALETVIGEPLHRLLSEAALVSPGPAIYGGTDQVQRNILGERVLGLPKEPGNERTTPFRDLPKN